MKYIETVGNLDLYYGADITGLFEGFIVYAYNGPDLVIKDAYTGRCNAWTIREAVNRLLRMQGIYCREWIYAGLQHVTIENGGRLIFGNVAGFTETEYFLQIENTRFFKYHAERPAV